jgi:hypothetical protein
MRGVAGRMVGGGAQELRRGMTLDVAESAPERASFRGLVRSAYQRAAVSASSRLKSHKSACSRAFSPRCFERLSLGVTRLRFSSEI